MDDGFALGHEDAVWQACPRDLGGLWVWCEVPGAEVRVLCDEIVRDAGV